MVEELALSLDEDEVARSLLHPHRSVLVQDLRQRISRPAELETLVRFIHGRLRPKYRAALEQRLKELLVENKEKAEIARVGRSWVTQLINEGFAAGNVFYSVTQRFFSSEASPKISDLSELDAFFASFGPEPGGWNVMFKVSPSFAGLETVATELNIAISATAPAPTSTFLGEKAFLENNPEGFLFAKVSPVKARDAVSARNRADDLLRTLANLGYLHAHRADFRWSPDALVYNAATQWVTHLDEPTPHVLKRPDCPAAMVGEFARKTYGILKRANFDVTSTTRLAQILDLHAAALKAPTPENQLLNFWAAIETLLPPPSEPGRIAHIVRSASPLLCRAYPVKLIRHLLDTLRGCLPGRAEAVLARIPQGSNQFEKVAALVALKESERYRDELYKLCKPNPLLRFRLFSLFKGLSSAPAIRETIESHRRRVDWHVQRIYRSRNLLLHAGETLPYLGILIENVHSYLDRMLDLVRHALNVRRDLRTLDEALLEVNLDHSAHMEVLLNAGKEHCTPDTFLELLFGPRPDVASLGETAET
jgi:hypothetical protein